MNQKAVQDIDSEIDQLDSDDSDELTRQLLSLLEGDKDEEAAVRAKPRRVRASKGKSKSKKVIPARDLLAKLPEEVLQSVSSCRCMHLIIRPGLLTTRDDLLVATRADRQPAFPLRPAQPRLRLAQVSQQASPCYCA